MKTTAHTQQEIDAARRRAVNVKAAEAALARRHGPALALQGLIAEVISEHGPQTLPEVAGRVGLESAPEKAGKALEYMGRKMHANYSKADKRWSLTNLGRRELIEGKVYPA